mmetsp:Transcript_67750/g.181238  ORF Transcript_67750/g.181238 Transcript_67750/m.181238 type:complete len:225 (-) Transcript_67750:246-920(-)
MWAGDTSGVGPGVVHEAVRRVGEPAQREPQPLLHRGDRGRGDGAAGHRGGGGGGQGGGGSERRRRPQDRAARAARQRLRQGGGARGQLDPAGVREDGGGGGPDPGLPGQDGAAQPPGPRPAEDAPGRREALLLRGRQEHHRAGCGGGLLLHPRLGQRRGAADLLGRDGEEGVRVQGRGQLRRAGAHARRGAPGHRAHAGAVRVLGAGPRHLPQDHDVDGQAIAR